MANIETLKQVACSAIDEAADDLYQMSQHIWNTPELMFEEHQSHKTVTDFLEQRGFPVERHHVLMTGFRSVYNDICTGSCPNIAILCEYDALPDLGHACGHNLIAEVGVGASIGIKAALDQAKHSGYDLGKLTVVGTPAEEGGNGKDIMLQGGAFDSVDIAMMAHPSHLNLLDSPGDTCTQSLDVKFIGQESHAADTPWEGVNALDAAFMAYGNIAVLRQQMKPGWRVHGIITRGGTAANIIPSVTEMKYLIRTPFMKELGVLRDKITACFQGAAASTGCNVDLRWSENPYYNVITNSVLGDLYTNNAAPLGIDMVEDFQGTLGGSTDMGNISHAIPAIHPIFSLDSDAKCHTKEFTDIAGAFSSQHYTLQQAKCLALTAIDAYCKPDLIDAMKNKLREDLLKEDQAS